MPLPTTITWAGSCPDPEPWTIDTLSSRGASGPHDQVVLGHVGQRVRVGQRDALEHLGDELLGVVDELLHDCSLGRPRLVDVFHEYGHRHRAGVDRTPAPLPRVGRPPAFRDHLGRRLGGLPGGGRRGRQHAIRVRARLQFRSMRVRHRDQRVQQRLVADVGLAAHLDPVGRGAQHRDDVSPVSGPAVPAVMPAFMKAVPQMRPGGAADPRADDHPDLLQEGPGVRSGRCRPSPRSPSRSRGPGNTRSPRRRRRNRGHRNRSRCRSAVCAIVRTTRSTRCCVSLTHTLPVLVRSRIARAAAALAFGRLTPAQARRSSSVR